MKKLICFLILLCGVSSGLVATPSRSTTEITAERHFDQLLLLMQKRLAIMHEVARTKWNHQLPIEDLARENELLKSLVKHGDVKYNLDPEWVGKFFQAQFDAAKEVQKQDFALWREQGILKFEHVFRLKDDLRPYIDQINHEMLELLSKIRNSSFPQQAPLSIRPSDAVSEPIWRIALSGF